MEMRSFQTGRNTLLLCLATAQRGAENGHPWAPSCGICLAAASHPTLLFPPLIIFLPVMPVKLLRQNSDPLSFPPSFLSFAGGLSSAQKKKGERKPNEHKGSRK